MTVGVKKNRILTIQDGERICTETLAMQVL